MQQLNVITSGDRAAEVSRRQAGRRASKSDVKRGRARHVGELIDQKKCSVCGGAPYYFADSKAGDGDLCRPCLRRLYSNMTNEAFEAFLERQEAQAEKLREAQKRVKHYKKTGKWLDGEM